MKYKNFEIPNNYIDKMVDTLNISIGEACEIWLADNNKIEETQEQKDLTKKAKDNNIKNVGYSEKERKPSTRIIKPDETKILLIQILAQALVGSEIECNIENVQKTITFNYKGDSYSVNLTKHRLKKKGSGS